LARVVPFSLILAPVAGIQRPDVGRVKRTFQPKDLGWSAVPLELLEIPVTSTGMTEILADARFPDELSMISSLSGGLVPPGTVTPDNAHA